VLISCEDADDYKRNFRLQLRAMVDPETRAPLAAEPVFVYVRPPDSPDAAGKGAARVVDAMRRELGSRQRERVVRLDPPPPPPPGRGAPGPDGGVPGVDDLLGAVQGAVRCALEARAAAYQEATRRQLAAAAADPAWSFCDLFLVKDSLGAMMEAAGLLEDALREYLELEVCHQQARSAGRFQRPDAGAGPAAGEDEAAPLWASWAQARAAGAGEGDGAAPPPEAQLRQAVFAQQARVLLRLRRHAEVLQRGLALVRATGAALGEQSAAGTAPALAAEAWAGAACLSLAAVVSTLHAQQQHGGAEAAAAAAAPTALDAPPPGTNGADAAAPIDWRLGVLPLPRHAPGLPEPPSAHPAGDAAAAGAAATSTMCRLLGELYCLARLQLERLGAATGLSPPRNPAHDVAAALRALGAPAAAPAADLPAAAASSGTPVSVGSPRLVRGRSLSPSRVSLDVSGRALSMLAGGMADSDDEISSLRIDTGGAAALAASLQTVDLTAAAAAAMSALDTEAAAAAAAAAPESASPGAAAVAELQLEPAPSAAVASPAAKQLGAGEPGDGGASPAPIVHARSISFASATDGGSERGGGAAAPSRASLASLRTGAGGAAAGASGSESGGPSTPTSASGAAPQRSSSSPAPRAPTPGGQAAAPTLRRVEHSIVTAAAAAARTSAASEGASSRPDSAQAGPLAVWTPVHWRLRLALASPAAFADLWRSLSQAAAACLEAGGRRRQALLLQADVGDALAASGALLEAAQAYEALCRAALREGWAAEAEAALAKLAACQAALGGAGVAASAAALAALLARNPAAAGQLPSAAQLLLRAARLPDDWLPFPPLAVPPGGGGPLDALAPLDPAGFLSAAVLRGSYSRFYGHSDAAGQPVLVPTRPAAGAAGGPPGGAAAAAVGDVLVLTLEVVNRLPVELPLGDVALTLVGMQEMAGAPGRAWFQRRSRE
jgi:hypothetical protein